VELLQQRREPGLGYDFIEGNEAIARGAVRAGCDFFASYPITPASTILNHMLDLLPETGGIAIQAEDEIASMGFCIGAAMAGSRVLTSTSGPGMSLYSENIGLAIMGETPMVIVDVQRQGPATGSATQGAEGDIQFARWGTSGGLPVIALSPASVGEAYQLTYLAFNFAEKYRAPVLLLTNKEVGMTKESVDLEAIPLPPLARRKRVPSGRKDYLPHLFETPGEVPAISDFGGEYVARYTTSTHDKRGYLTTKPEVIQEMIDHYTAKIEEAVEEISLVREDLEEGADTLVVSYGVISRSAAVAIREARSRGRKVSSLVLQTLWPVPEKAIMSAMRGVDRIVVPEMNMGQYRLEIERLAPPEVTVVGVCKMDTTLVSPQEILERGGLS
jgi:2-oxoglutarate ferredoxin oxidoreductase subunit alpha